MRAVNGVVAEMLSASTTNITVCATLFPPLVPAGEKLCSLEDCIEGTGVYPRHGYIYSSLAGYVLKKNEGGQVSGVGGGQADYK